MKVKNMIDERPVRMQYNIVDCPGYIRGQGELLDQTPLALPFDCKKPETLEQAIDRIMKVRSSRDLDNEWESEEEAEDFDTEEDDEIFDTPYTLFDEIPEGGSPINAPAAASADDSAPAPEPTPKKRKNAKVTAEPEPMSEDDE